MKYFIVSILLFISPTLLFAQDIQATLHTESDYQNVKIAGDKAYAVSQWGLEIYDIADFSDPVKLGECYTPGLAHNLDVHENLVYVTDFEQGLSIIDVSDPQQPKLVSNFRIPRESPYSTLSTIAVKFHQNYAYLSTHAGMYTLDVEDPYRPELTDRFFYSEPYGESYFDYAWFNQAFIEDTLLYVSVTNISDGLQIFSISDPAHPAYLRTVYDGHLNFMYIENDIIYGAGSYAVQSFDNSQGNTVTLLGQSESMIFDFRGEIKNFAYNNGRIAVVGLDGIWLVDASDPQNITTLSKLIDKQTYFGLDWDGNHLITCNGYNGLKFWEVDPEYNLNLITKFQCRGHAHCLRKFNNLICFKTDSSQLGVYDISIPRHPVLENQIVSYPQSFYNFADFEICDNKLYTANYGNGIKVYDIYKDGNLDLKYTYTYEGKSYIDLKANSNLVVTVTPNCNDVFIIDGDELKYSGELKNVNTVLRNLDIQGNIMVGSDDCLKIFDIHDPEDITITCSLNNIPAAINDLILDGSRLYAILGQQILVYDITDPSAAQLLYTWPDGSEPEKVNLNIVNARIFEDYLFLFGTDTGITVVDISDPLDFNIAGQFDTPGQAYDGIIDSLYIYCADLYGATIIKHNLFDIPDNPTPRVQLIRSNFPNPFNTETLIDYYIPQDGHIEIMVYNVLGQKVNTLVSAYQQAGEHRTGWDGSNSAGEKCASGIYVCRLVVGDISDWRLMAYLR